MRESHLRSVLKGVTWRVLATSTTVTIAYFITGDVKSALSIGGIEFFGKLGLYYLHERIQMVKYGRTLALTKFSSTIVNNEYLKVIKSI